MQAVAKQKFIGRILVYQRWVEKQQSCGWITWQTKTKDLNVGQYFSIISYFWKVFCAGFIFRYFTLTLCMEEMWKPVLSKQKFHSIATRSESPAFSLSLVKNPGKISFQSWAHSWANSHVLGFKVLWFKASMRFLARPNLNFSHTFSLHLTILREVCLVY